jgi:hypothetical protein
VVNGDSFIKFVREYGVNNALHLDLGGKEMVPMRLVNLREKGFEGGKGRRGRLKLVRKEMERFGTGNACEGTWIL